MPGSRPSTNKPDQNTLDQLLDNFINKALYESNFCLPGVIEKFYPGDEKVADIQLSIPQVYDLDDKREVPVPVLPKVPILFPATSEFSITFPIAKDDPVLVVFCQRSLEEWKNNEDRGPKDPRRNSFNDGFAIPGMFRPNQGPTVDSSKVIIKYNDSFFALDGTNVELNGSDYTGVRFSEMKDAFDEFTGDFNNFITTFNLHTHNVPQAPSGTTVSGPPNSSGSSTASDMTTAESETVKMK
jgi:hypothetical protein